MSATDLRRCISLHGAVQGTGFRPFLYRLATEIGLNGWVCNTAFGLITEVEGLPVQVEEFSSRLESEKPAMAMIAGMEWEDLPANGLQGFHIRESQDGPKAAFILPDLAICPECRKEILTPGYRRYHYPFTNCTQCGPRYTILNALPYDRPNTTMRSFELCPQCRAEYLDPEDRRFHAQPIACPVCGPHLTLWDEKGRSLAEREEALSRIQKLLAEGHIIALKGIGGFQLLVDACNPTAVERLRLRKRREAKPFAVMYPNLSMVRRHCRIGELETRILEGPAAPILLLSRLSGTGDAREPASVVAPDNPYLGVMLPYSPLHELILRDWDGPLVATSGNISDEPMCIDESEALDRLSGIADYFLIHNRPIVRPVDDSIVRVLHGQQQILRRARGYSPLPITIRENSPAYLAVGGHLKNAIALSRGRHVFISQHIGDLETTAADRVFRHSVDSLCRIYQVRPQQVLCDAHPDYLSTRYAVDSGLPCRSVQHHAAHALSVIAEQGLEPPVLAVVWDGTGYGPDQTVWGGEWFLYREGQLRHVARLRQFSLPGSERAVREAYCAAIGLLWEYFEGHSDALDSLAWTRQFAESERNLLYSMLRTGRHCPRTSSIGRLFDAVASLMNLRHRNRFEGDAAMSLEFECRSISTQDSYELLWRQVDGRSGEASDRPFWEADWSPMLGSLLEDIRRGESPPLMATKFHNALVQCIVSFAGRMQIRRVLVSGGCFQNRLLMEKLAPALSGEHELAFPQKVPPNDGGIALGQIYAAVKDIVLL